MAGNLAQHILSAECVWEGQDNNDSEEKSQHGNSICCALLFRASRITGRILNSQDALHVSGKRLFSGEALEG